MVISIRTLGHLSKRTHMDGFSISDSDLPIIEIELSNGTQLLIETQGSNGLTITRIGVAPVLFIKPRSINQIDIVSE